MDVLKLNTGEIEMIGDVEDFSDLLYRKLGSDVRDWFDSLIATYEANLEIANLQVEEDEYEEDEEA